MRVPLRLRYKRIRLNMTSANTIYYKIQDLDGKRIGEYSWNFYCKPKWEYLLKYEPPEKFIITPYGYDEEENEWEDPPENLETFLRNRKIIS